jgi:hypothetical protein
MTEQKTALTKQEKEAIKNSSASGTMSEEEFARVQGMTVSELRSESTGFRDWIERSEKE